MNNGTNAINSDITIFRNMGFVLPMDFQNISGYPINLTGYNFCLAIAPTPAKSASFGTPVLRNIIPVVNTTTGLITFTLSVSDTVSLTAGLAYQYVVMSQAPSQAPMVNLYGRCKVLDAPSFVG